MYNYAYFEESIIRYILSAWLTHNENMLKYLTMQKTILVCKSNKL